MMAAEGYAQLSGADTVMGQKTAEMGRPFGSGSAFSVSWRSRSGLSVCFRAFTERGEHEFLLLGFGDEVMLLQGSDLLQVIDFADGLSLLNGLEGRLLRAARLSDR